MKSLASCSSDGVGGFFRLGGTLDKAEDANTYDKDSSTDYDVCNITFKVKVHSHYSCMLRYLEEYTISIPLLSSAI